MDNTTALKFTRNDNASLNGTSFHGVEVRAPLSRCPGSHFTNACTFPRSSTKVSWTTPRRPTYF
jgi:hypothetical protein